MTVIKFYFGVVVPLIFLACWVGSKIRKMKIKNNLPWGRTILSSTVRRQDGK